MRQNSDSIIVFYSNVQLYGCLALLYYVDVNCSLFQIYNLNFRLIDYIKYHSVSNGYSVIFGLTSVAYSL